MCVWYLYAGAISSTRRPLGIETLAEVRRTLPHGFLRVVKLEHDLKCPFWVGGGDSHTWGQNPLSLDCPIFEGGRRFLNKAPKFCKGRVFLILSVCSFTFIINV